MATKYSTCTLCEAHCGIVVETDGDRVVKITGDKEDPFSRGYICPKARALEELHHDPDRLKTPLRRRPGGGHEKISWEDAFEITADRLREIRKKHGRDAVSLYLGNPNVHNTQAVLHLQALGEVLGTRNMASATSLDQLPTMLTNHLMYGHQFLFNIPDIDRTAHMVLLGANPLASNGSIMSAPNVKGRLRAISERGGKTVVIDPRRTKTAELCDEHFFIRPGSDAVLLLAWLSVLKSKDLVKPGRLADFTRGWEVLEILSSIYSPAEAEGHTGIAAADIERMAVEFARAESAVLYPRVGVSVHEYGALCHYLVTVINLVTGNLDRPGGMMFTRPAVDLVDLLARGGKKGSFNTFQSRVKGLPEFNGEIPAATLPDEILTPGNGQIRALITAAGNPVLSAPNGKKFEQALASLDFMLSVDIYLNETTRHADIILPPTGPLERNQFDIIFPTLSVRNHIKYSPAVIEPGSEQRSDEQIYRELVVRLASGNSIGRGIGRMIMGAVGVNTLLGTALRIGPYGDRFNPFSSGLNLARLKAEPHGVDLGELQPALPGRLFTRNKTINLDQQLFLDDIKRLKEQYRPGTSPAADGSFALISRRDLRANNSWMHNLPRLHGGRQLCRLLMNPADAGRLGIVTGSDVELKSRVGRAQVCVEVSEEVMPGVVCLPHGFGHDRSDTGLSYATAENCGVSVNDLTDDELYDRLCGTAALNSTSVTLTPVKNRVQGEALASQ